jgi:DNA polymerase I
MYGISAFGLSQNLGIDREEAAAYIDRYFERLPRVKAFIEGTIERRGCRDTWPRSSGAAGPYPS